MSIERKRRYRARFVRMGEAATRKWLASAEHHLRRQQEHVNAARFALEHFAEKAAAQPAPHGKENGDAACDH